MENKLRSMVDFVLVEYSIYDKFYYDKLISIKKYAEFLKRPLELWMFVPCDEKGNVLKEPNENDCNLGDIHSGVLHQKQEEYKKAFSKVLFEGFKYDDVDDVVYYYNSDGGYCQIDITEKEFIIEDLIDNNLTLTNNALKIWE